MHPSHLIGAEARAVVEAWSMWRGGMAPGPLPFAGGIGDQPACLLTAFAVASEAARKLEAREKGKGDGG